MKNIRIIIEYDGTDFYGWQEQPGLRTVQGEIQRGARQILGEGIRITGASRTDHGVHALAQVAHFVTSSIKPLEAIRCGINAVTGRDVHIRSIDAVDLSFHSRFSARSKTYQYHIAIRPSPIRRRYAWTVPYRIDCERMNAAAAMFKGRFDFRHFSAREDSEKDGLCEILAIGLTMLDEEIIITVEADRFLRRMVRGLVGFLVDVGRNRFRPEKAMEAQKGEIKDIFFAPAQGLFLVKVNY